MILKAGHPRKRVCIEDSHVTYDLLSISGSSPERILEAVIGEYPPHYDCPLVTHDGEEFGYVLEGSITLIVDDKEYLLEPGDTFHFFSSHAHTVRNPTDQLAKVLLVLTLKFLEGGEKSL